MRLTLSVVDDADHERLRAALAEIVGNSPSVNVSVQTEKTYTVSGDSESYLRSICDRIRGEYNCGITVSPIKAVFLETIRKQTEAEGKYIRQTGGSGNYGHCQLRIEPQERGKGYLFVNDIKAGVMPKEYITSIDEGVQGALELGIISGFPIVDVKVTLCDGSYHESDSNQMAFKFAGSIAFKEAARKAHPVLLEPLMAIEIEVPEEVSAAIRLEVHGHRGRIERHRIVDGLSQIEAIVPLPEILGSASSGLAQFPMEFAGYEVVSDHGPSTDSGVGETANKPNYPRPGRQSDPAPIEHEDD